MCACLVQQLFRQKVHIELDPRLVDEVLFPMLRSRKHPSKDLLMDIKLTQRWGEHDCSMITMPGRRFLSLTDPPQLRAGRYHPMKNMSPFTRIPPTLESKRAEQEVVEKERLGEVTSRFRREMTIKKNWGTVDILNELRELKHPMIECHPVTDSDRHFDLLLPEIEWYVENPAYIRLEETCDTRLWDIVNTILNFDTWGSWSKSPLYSDDEMIREKEKAIIKNDLKFVNLYLEHSLSNGGLYWEISAAGSPPRFALTPCF